MESLPRNILAETGPLFALALAFRKQKGMTPKDLVPMIGRINRVYEVLSRRRPLTLAMIQRLHSDLGIPAESLIKQPERRKVA